jgi:hypothetical protein
LMKYSRENKGQLLQKWSNQTALRICESPYGNKQACIVLRKLCLK